MEINVPVYGSDGFSFIWDDNFSVRCSVQGSLICIEANQAGLISLARHFLELAQDGTPEFAHIHLDEFNSLETGSAELIVIRQSSSR